MASKKYKLRITSRSENDPVEILIKVQNAIKSIEVDLIDDEYLDANIDNEDSYIGSSKLIEKGEKLLNEQVEIDDESKKDSDVSERKKT